MSTTAMIETELRAEWVRAADAEYEARRKANNTFVAAMIASAQAGKAEDATKDIYLRLNMARIRRENEDAIAAYERSKAPGPT